MSVIPTPIASVPHLKGLDDAVIDRVNQFPVEVVMTFLMGVLEESALDTMATDLSVNGVGGFAQAQTEAERRGILFNAVRTRKRTGTPWAIKRAIETLGYSTPVIIEGYGSGLVSYDGNNNYTGVISYNSGGGGWAEFVVILPESELIVLTQNQIDQLVQYINHYKNARSKLVGIGYYDSLAPQYDGLFTYDGNTTYSGLPQNTIIFVT